MIRKIKIALISLVLSLGLVAPGLIPAVASAVSSSSPTSVDTSNTINNGLCTGINNAAGGVNANSTNGCFSTDAGGGNSLASVARTIINTFSIIVGIVAVIMVIYGGFRYITSGGSGDKVSSAKNTLIYAIIGLVIVALAQFLVHFVLTTSTSAV